MNLNNHFPVDKFGDVHSILPVHVGLSGAGVYSAKTSKGSVILRLHGKEKNNWDDLKSTQVWAAEQNITPDIYHICNHERAVISAKIENFPLGMVFRDPQASALFFESLVTNIKNFHLAPADSLSQVDIIDVIKTFSNKESKREAFPIWADIKNFNLDEKQNILHSDKRVVVSHNDLNPSNILWDGTRAWIIDFESASLNHPYYDMASMTAFMNIADEMSFTLLEKQEGVKLSEDNRKHFKTLQKLSLTLYGHIFLSLIPDLKILSQITFDEVKSIKECYAMMGEGKLDLQTSEGQGLFALALLKTSLLP